MKDAWAERNREPREKQRGTGETLRTPTGTVLGAKRSGKRLSDTGSLLLSAASGVGTCSAPRTEISRWRINHRANEAAVLSSSH